MMTGKNRYLIFFAFFFVANFTQGREPLFYQPSKLGSESLFNPASSFLSYTLDSLQIKSVFGTQNYEKNVSTVIEHLRHPSHQIDAEGGYIEFVTTEIFPIDLSDLDGSEAVLPNYGLHLFGGGLIYRKNAEWFEAHDLPFPYVMAGVLSMAAEILAEPLEKPTTDKTDEIADVYLFRPFGIWLYSNDKRAKFIKNTFDPVDWPHQMVYDPYAGEFRNIGVSYVVRPPRLSFSKARFFAYMGISNLFGLSHSLSNGDEVSWGLGVSTVYIKPSIIRESAGLFWDRNNSLLASLIINGSENMALRANVYPGVLFDKKWPLGFFAGLDDDGDALFGLQFGWPIGLSIGK